MISPGFTVLDFSIQSLDGGIQTGFHSIEDACRMPIMIGNSSMPTPMGYDFTSFPSCQSVI